MRACCDVARPAARRVRRPADCARTATRSPSSCSRCCLRTPTTKTRDVGYLRLRDRFPDFLVRRSVQRTSLVARPAASRARRSAQATSLRSSQPAHQGDPSARSAMGGADHSALRWAGPMRRLGMMRASYLLTPDRRRAGASGGVRAAVRLSAGARSRWTRSSHAWPPALALLARGRALSRSLHDQMLALQPPERELKLHVNLLRHGRRTCHARRPTLRRCALARMCPSQRTYTCASTALISGEAPRRR